MEIEKYQEINNEGLIKLIDYYIERIDKDLLVFQDDFQYGLASLNSKTGKANIIVKAIFDDIQPFIDDLAIVVKDSLYGVIDRSGKYIIEPKFRDIIYDKNIKRFIVSEKYGQKGIIDIEGYFKLEPFASAIVSMGPFKGNLAVITRADNKKGIINADGKIIIKPKYSNLIILDESRLMYPKSFNRWVIMDYQENKIETKRFNRNLEIIDFYGNIGLGQDRKMPNNSVLFDLEGNYIIGYVKAQSGFKYDTFFFNTKKYGRIYNKEGNLINKNISSMEIYDDGTYIYDYEGEFRSGYVKSDKKVGIYNAFKNINKSIKGDHIFSYSNGYFAIQRTYTTNIIANSDLEKVYQKNYIDLEEIERKGNLIVVNIKHNLYEVIDIKGNQVMEPITAHQCLIVDDNYLLIDNYLVPTNNIKYKYIARLDKYRDLSFDSTIKRDKFISNIEDEIVKIEESEKNQINEIKEQTKQKIKRLMYPNDDH